MKKILIPMVIMLLALVAPVCAAPKKNAGNTASTNKGATGSIDKLDKADREKKKKDDSYGGKKAKAASKYFTDDNYLIIATLPNSAGSIDSYLSGKLFLSKRWVSWIEFESTSVKQATQTYSDPPLDLMSDYIIDKNYMVRADVIKYRFLDKRRGKLRKTIMDIGLFARYDYTMHEVRYTDIVESTPYTSFFLLKYELSFIQSHMKLSLLFVNGRRTLFHLYGGGGLFYGLISQDYIGYINDNGTEIKDTSNSDSTFALPGFTAGLNFYHNFGPVSIGISGSIAYSKGDADIFEYDAATGYFLSPATLRYISWQCKVEIGLKFIKIGKLSPSLIYSMSQTKLDADFGGGDGFENMTAQYNDEGEEIGIIHKFGFAMKI